VIQHCCLVQFPEPRAGWPVEPKRSRVEPGAEHDDLRAGSRGLQPVVEHARANDRVTRCLRLHLGWLRGERGYDVCCGKGRRPGVASSADCGRFGGIT